MQQNFSEQSDSEQPDSKQPDSKQPDSKQPDSKQTDSKRPDSKQPDSKQLDSEQPEQLLISYLVGNQEILSNMKTLRVLPMFSEQAVNFLGKLSQVLLKDKRTKSFPDILSYAFWMRNASIEKEKQKHLHIENRIGRGITFHIAPSNVPINFAVSMTSALLAGNACILRVSNKEFPQVDIICEAIRRLLEGECKEMRAYLCVVRYEHNEAINEVLSSMCDVRIIWGGNRTIETIRKAPLPPRAIEMAFPDRYSIAVIRAEEYLKADAKKVAKDFYTDTYYTDQNACSSPRLVVWMGEKKEEAKERFWHTLEELVRTEYDMKPIQAVDKYDSFCLLAAKRDGVTLESSNNYVNRVKIEKLDEEVMDYKNGSGYFFEYDAEQLEEIVPILGKTCQTVSYLGVSSEEIREIVYKYGVRGVDRIVPVGKTMELMFYWDGYDMVETMSRYVVC